MKKNYRVREGFAIRVDERTTHQGGDVVELDDDEAAMHAHKIEAVEQPAKPSKEKEGKGAGDASKQGKEEA